jgi:4-methoxybenzoate monooxygenase (O-demethylating)
MVARLEAEIVLNALIPRAKVIHLTEKPKRRLNNTLHAIAHLPVEIEPA